MESASAASYERVDNESVAANGPDRDCLTLTETEGRIPTAGWVLVAMSKWIAPGVVEYFLTGNVLFSSRMSTLASTCNHASRPCMSYVIHHIHSTYYIRTTYSSLDSRIRSSDNDL